MIKLFIGLGVSYLLGSLATAYWAGKITRGIDLRQHGSGNLGATNAFRVLGKNVGIAVLLIDILKGTLGVLLAARCFYSEQPIISKNLYLCFCAMAVVSGHNWTIFLNFKGGKGVATSLGALLGFSILVDHFVWLALGIIGLWLIVFLASGYVSLASVISSIALPVFSIIFRLPPEISIFLLLLGGLSVFRHKSNISRLLQKKESRFNTKSFLEKLFKKTLSS